MAYNAIFFFGQMDQYVSQSVNNLLVLIHPTELHQTPGFMS